MQALILEFPLPEEEENVEMEQDLKNALKEISKGVAALLENSAKQPSPAATPPLPLTTRLPTWATVLGIFVSIIAVLGAFWKVGQYTIASELTKALIEPNKAIAKLQDDRDTLRRDVDVLIIQRSTDVLTHPLGASPKALGTAALQLRGQKTVIPRQIAAEAGRAVLKNVSNTSSPESWDATARLLEYVSFLNAEANSGASFHMSPVPEDFKPPDSDAGTYFINPPGWQGEMRDGPASWEPDVAKLHPLGATTPSQTRSYGPAWLLMKGGVIKLDGQFMKRIVVRDAEVVYDGGPVSLDGVYFLNCTFVLPRKPSSELFASAVMSPNPETRFKSGL